MFAVAAAVCGLVLLWSTALSLSHTFPDLLAPSIGDVRLVNHTFIEDNVLIRGTVEIYYDDGVHGPQWGYVCKSRASKSTAQVVCRQLGYIDGDLNVYDADSLESEATDPHQPILRQTSTDQHVWLSDIHCKDNNKFSHILRCNHTVSSEDSGSCQHLNVTCNRQIPKLYNGQVRLCSPTEFPNVTQSTSFGVVQVYLRAPVGDWGGVNQYSMNIPLGYYEADSVCRQLGYTNAVTSYTMTVESASAIQSLNFKACASQTNTINTWFKTDDSALKCDRSQSCFGCCFPYPSDTQACSNSECSFTRDVVVKCEFDPRIAGNAKGGSAELCQFNHRQLSSQACSDPPDWKLIFEITVGVVGPLPFILFCALLIIAIVVCCVCCRRNRRRDRGGGEQAQLIQRPNDDDEH